MTQGKLSQLMKLPILKAGLFVGMVLSLTIVLFAIRRPSIDITSVAIGIAAFALNVWVFYNEVANNK